jgi:hypothetical protein
MVDTSKTKKRYLKTKNKKLNTLKKQIGGRIESITSDEYDKKLGIEDNNTYLKTILQHHFDKFGDYINITDKKIPKQVTINEPLLQNEGFLKRYSEVFQLLNQGCKTIHLNFKFDINKTLFDWNVFETNKDFINVYNVDIGRSIYVTKKFETINFEKSIKDNKPYKEILTKNKHCIDCSEDFIEQINTENSKIRNGFKLLITQSYPLIFLAPFNRYDQIITNELQIKQFSTVNVIINNCVYKIIVFEDIYNSFAKSALYGYIIIKYDPYINHKLSMMYYSTNNYFDLVNSSLRNTCQIINPIANIGILSLKNVLMEIKDMIIEYNLTNDESNLLRNNKSNLLRNKIYDYLNKYINNHIYFLKV